MEILLKQSRERSPSLVFKNVSQWAQQWSARGILSMLCLALALRFLWRLGATLARRVPFQGDLEWMEFGVLGHVLRILENKPIYGPPELGFVPYIYTPGYYYLGAAFSPLIGVGLPQLRMLSVAATLGSAFLLYKIAFRTGARRAVAALVPCLYLATFLSSGAWMDVARVDSVCLLSQLLALFFGLRRGGPSAVLAGLFVVIATLTKQYACVLVAPMLLHYAWSRRWSEGAVFAFSTLIAAILGFGFLHVQSDGWFWFWTWTIPRRHEMTAVPWDIIFREQGLIAVPFLALLAILGATHVLQQTFGTPDQRGERELQDRFFVLLVALTFSVQAYLSFRHTGSFLNCLMPYHLGASLLAGLALSRTRTARIPSELLVASALHFLQLELKPKDLVPTRQDRAIAGELREKSAAPTLVAVANHQAAALLPANLRLAQPMALVDLDRANEPTMMKELRVQAERRFAQFPYSEVILDDDFYVFLPELKKHYRLDHENSGRAATTMLVGARLSPHLVYVPRSRKP